MKYVLSACLTILCAPADVALAQTDSRMLKRQTARVIRNAGFWCDKIIDARIDKARSADGPYGHQSDLRRQNKFRPVQAHHNSR